MRALAEELAEADDLEERGPEEEPTNSDYPAHWAAIGRFGVPVLFRATLAPNCPATPATACAGPESPCKNGLSGMLNQGSDKAKSVWLVPVCLFQQPASSIRHCLGPASLPMPERSAVAIVRAPGTGQQVSGKTWLLGGQVATPEVAGIADQGESGAFPCARRCDSMKEAQGRVSLE